MNPGLLLAHFDRISDAPEAIPRLRRFVLDLAIRGKLVEQDPKDEPAAALLKRVQAKKAEIARGAAAKKAKPIPLMAENEIPFSIPTSWCWSRLAEIGFINPRNTAGDAVQSSFVPMPLISSEYGVANTHEVKPWSEIKSGFTHFAEGDVAVAKITPCFENGKSTIFRGLTGGIGAGTTELHVVRPVIVSADYVLIFLKCPHFIESGISRMTGTAGQKRVPTEYFACSPFPLPPLAEQYRIAAKVDELMGLCDHLDTARDDRERQRQMLVTASLHSLNNATDAEEFRENARFYLCNLPQLTISTAEIPALRQAILNLAVRGQLVPQNPDDDPASELLEHIQTEIAHSVEAGDTKERKNLQVSATKDAPFEIPRTWRWVTLNQIVFAFRYGTSVKCSYEQAGEPVLRIPNIVNGAITVEDLKFGSLSKREADQLRLRLGDILVVRSNGSLDLVGRPALVDAKAMGYCYAGYLIRVRLSTTYLAARYVLLALNSAHVRDQIEIPIRTTVGLKNVNATELASLVIPLPPLAEQNRIVAKVDELMALCDQLEAQLTITQSEKRSLLEAVLHHALTDTLESTSPKRPNTALLTGDHIRGTTQSCRGGQKSDFGILSDAIRTALK